MSSDFAQCRIRFRNLKTALKLVFKQHGRVGEISTLPPCIICVLKRSRHSRRSLSPSGDSIPGLRRPRDVVCRLGSSRRRRRAAVVVVVIIFVPLVGVPVRPPRYHCVVWHSKLPLSGQYNLFLCVLQIRTYGCYFLVLLSGDSENDSSKKKETITEDNADTRLNLICFSPLAFTHLSSFLFVLFHA